MAFVGAFLAQVGRDHVRPVAEPRLECRQDVVVETEWIEIAALVVGLFALFVAAVAFALAVHRRRQIPLPRRNARPACLATFADVEV